MNSQYRNGVASLYAYQFHNNQTDNEYRGLRVCQIYCPVLSGFCLIFIILAIPAVITQPYKFSNQSITIFFSVSVAFLLTSIICTILACKYTRSTIYINETTNSSDGDSGEELIISINNYDNYDNYNNYSDSSD